MIFFERGGEISDTGATILILRTRTGPQLGAVHAMWEFVDQICTMNNDSKRPKFIQHLALRLPCTAAAGSRQTCWVTIWAAGASRPTATGLPSVRHRRTGATATCQPTAPSAPSPLSPTPQSWPSRPCTSYAKTSASA